MTQIYLPFVTGAHLPRIDMLPYMRGDGRIYEVMLVDADGNQHQARHQTQIDPALPGAWYQTKNHEWEHMAADDNHIYRTVDTSPGNGEYYSLIDHMSSYGSRWCPRYWWPGDIYEREPLVTFHRKSDCAIVRQGTHRTWLRFTYQFPTWPTPMGPIADVIQLDWLLSLEEGAEPEESYYYANGWGLVGWAGRGHYAAPVELHQPGARPDNVREVIPCLGALWRKGD